MATPTATGGTQIAWVYGDHLGVPLLAMDSGGNQLALSGFAVQGFPGQRRTLPDLYYNRYRDYDPSTGRYIQADPIGLAGGPSPYSYAMNNPLRYTDPTGEFVPLVGAIIVGAVYGGLEGGLSDIGGQLLSGRSLNCIDWSSVGRSAAGGALIGGAFGGGGVLIARFGGPALRGLRGFASRGSGASRTFPAIKPGASGGPTAGQPFSKSVKDAAKAENPTKTCVYCRRDGVADQVDHSIAKSKGGDATIDNAQMACPHCNPSKGAREFPVNPPPDYVGKWPPPIGKDRIMKYLINDKIYTHDNPVWRDRSNLIFRVHEGLSETGSSWEQLWGQDIGNFQCIVCCIPFFIYDISLGDLVKIDTDYTFIKILRRSENITFRIWFGGQPTDEKNAIFRELNKFHLDMEWSSENLLALSVNKEKSDSLNSYLQKKESDGHFSYERG